MKESIPGRGLPSTKNLNNWRRDQIKSPEVRPRAKENAMRLDFMLLSLTTVVYQIVFRFLWSIRYSLSLERIEGSKTYSLPLLRKTESLKQDVSIQNELLLKMKKAQDFCSATWSKIKILLILSKEFFEWSYFLDCFWQDGKSLCHKRPASKKLSGPFFKFFTEKYSSMPLCA